MAQVAAIVMEKTSTVCSFGSYVDVTINLTIPSFSSYKMQTAALVSDKVIVGMSAWQILLHPLSLAVPEGKETADVKSAAIYARHEFLGIGKKEFKPSCTFNVLGPPVKITDGIFRDNVVCSKKSDSSFNLQQHTMGIPSFFPHSMLWGPKSILRLQSDKLVVQVKLFYQPTENQRLKTPTVLDILQEKLRTLHNSDIGKDFVLVSSQGTERRVHRAILSASSSFFASIFQADVKECRSGRYGMPKVATATLDAMIRFLYDHRPETLKMVAEDVYVAAGIYDMVDLKEVCEELLIADIANDTAVDMLLLAVKISAPALKKAALRHLALNLTAMDDSEQMKKLADSGNGKLFREVLSAVAQGKAKGKKRPYPQDSDVEE